LPRFDRGQDVNADVLSMRSLLTTILALCEPDEPHQFRTRNYLIKTQRTRSKANKAAANSTKLIDFPPLITVWLQVRVLPGPPKC
jgi:hypothetical protein